MTLIVKKRGIARTMIYAHISDGTFPMQIQLGSRSVVLYVRDVADYINEQLSNTLKCVDQRPLTLDQHW